MAKEKPFATEVDLCARFIGTIDSDWTAYAETEGWDILLVRKEDGFQIGIEAKLRLNAEVVAQTLENRYSATTPGPDCRAVLVPHDQGGPLAEICAHLGVTVIRVWPDGRPGFYRPFDPELPHLKDSYIFAEQWFERAPAQRHKLPEYVPDVAAGASAPLQLTRWKIAAIKLAIILETRGYVTRADFKALGLDHRRWITPAYEWLRNENGRWIAGDRLPDFKAQHPRVYAEIAADANKWMPPAPLLTGAA